MPRTNRVSRQILELLKDGKPRSMRELQSELGVQWNSVYWNLKEPDNPNNLIRRGCVEAVKTRGELSRFAQDEHVFKPGPNFEKCLFGIDTGEKD